MRRGVSLALMLASGFAGLGYQIVWTQQAALWMGHESAAVLAVVAAFFGGLTVGALALGTRIERARRPVRWYAACEVVIAAWGLLLMLLMRPLGMAVLDLAGAQPSAPWQWTVAFSAMFLALLPATAAMGATLPAMERVAAHLQATGRSLAALYASNTLGAVLGVLATAFWLIPDIGLSNTAALCIGLNLWCAVAALLTFPSSSGAVLTSAPSPPSATRDALLRLAFTGLLGIGYEVVVVRVLSQVCEDTVYTFAALLAVYLGGTALGAAAFQRWFRRFADGELLRDRLLSLLCAACLASTASLWSAENIRVLWTDHWGGGLSAALGAEAVLGVVAFGLPTLVMGALFSHLSATAKIGGISFGRSLGFNTLGAAAAPLVFGVLVAPALGAKFTLLLIAAGYLALTRRGAWLSPTVGAPAGVVLALALWAPPLSFIDIPEGGRVVSYQEGAMAAVSVVEDAEGISRLRINNRQQEGSSSSLLVDGRQALLPLLLHAAPQRALFLGLGTGVTASVAAEDPTLQVTAVELLPEVIVASQHFRQPAVTAPPMSRLSVVAADARRFVRTTTQHYDVIVSDNFHPARSGSGALYTVEHFQAVRERLTSDGLFCQWLPLHQLDLATLRSIVQSFMKVYPEGSAILASNSLETPVIGLVGQAHARPFDVDVVRARLARNAWPRRPAAFGIEDEFALLGSFIAGPASLRRFAGDAPANTDDLPVVAYRAPRITYRPDSLPRDRLMSLLGDLGVNPADVVARTTDPAWAGRLSAYWEARHRFLEAGTRVRLSGNVVDMLAQVREPLLSQVRLSPDFRPAYDPLLRMAAAVGETDPSSERALLLDLARAQPARPEADAALRGLAARNP